jgi:hypothetical protein
MEVPPSTIYHPLRSRLQRTEAHGCQQKFTLGEEQAIVARVEKMALWCCNGRMT